MCKLDLIVKLSDDIIVQNYGRKERSNPIEFSFLSYSHPGMNINHFHAHLIFLDCFSDMMSDDLSSLSNVKVFIDSLLFIYQSDRNIHFEIKRDSMMATPYREDPMFGKINTLPKHKKSSFFSLCKGDNEINFTFDWLDFLRSVREQINKKSY